MMIGTTVDKILSQGYLDKDLNSRIYKMKTVINGPKHKKQEPMAINDPATRELIVNEEAIKNASLLHTGLQKRVILPNTQHSHFEPS